MNDNTEKDSIATLSLFYGSTIDYTIPVQNSNTVHTNRQVSMAINIYDVHGKASIIPGP